MAETRTIKVANGDGFTNIHIYKCNCCGNDVPEHDPHEKSKSGQVYCGDCAFKLGIINDKEYLSRHLFFLNIDGLRATVKDGEIFLSTSKFPWELTSRRRDCLEYKEWRKSVFVRDNFTCVNCGKVGGTLNAHHIKEYAKYEKLRYDVSNGVTLCEECHREIHRKKV